MAAVAAVLLPPPHFDPSTNMALLTFPLSTLPAGRRPPPRRPLPISAAAVAGDLEGKASCPQLNRIPTPPWMRAPFHPPEQLLDLSKPTRSKKKRPESDESDVSLTGRVRGGRNRKTMLQIVRSVNNLRRLRQPDEPAPAEPSTVSSTPVVKMEGLWEAIRAEQMEKPIAKKLPWARSEKKLGFPRLKKEKAPTAAELTLERACLLRLRREAAVMRKWVKVKKAGVTDEKVEGVKGFWKESELAMLKFDEPLCRNMERAHEIVETKTGGMVVWVKKNSLVVYRGSDYQHPVKPFSEPESSHNANELGQDGSLASTKKINSSLMVNGTLYEREGDRLLDGLGPRFIDWWGPKPFPVDADLLPELLPGFRPPRRICPPSMREQLTDYELTYYRKIARPLPTHFVLGRNSKLQGLANAMLKLWEKSLIAKIAVKFGALNTSNERMASELKQLTGGVLILRNKYFIIFFRGKDFLPTKISNLVSEREQVLKSQVFLEEDARLEAAKILVVDRKLPCENISISGTFAEYQAMQSILPPNDIDWEAKVQIAAEKKMLDTELKRVERSQSALKRKVGKSEKKLMKLNSMMISSGKSADQELLTEEERQNFLNIGTKMTQVLVLGRRGVYNGVVESLHQHWKHREVVKVITMQRNFSQIMKTARLLETASGGTLISLKKLKQGHAIVIYRGKNYHRPSHPSNLLTKREALSRSIEMQRRGSMKFYVHQKQLKINDLKDKLKVTEQRAEQVSPHHLVSKQSAVSENFESIELKTSKSTLQHDK